MPAVLEQPAEPLAQQHLVLGDHDAHGSSAVRVVPCRGGFRRAGCRRGRRRGRAGRAGPNRRRARRRRRRRTTLTTRWPSRLAALTTTAVARECLIALVSPSHAMKYAAASIPSRTARRSFAPRPAAALGRPAPAGPARARRRAATAASPWASSRSSSIAIVNSATARSSASRVSCAGARPRRCWAWRSWSPIETSRCCAPSCRSRSIRRRSALPAARIRAREAWTSASWRRSSHAQARDLDREPARLDERRQRIGTLRTGRAVQDERDRRAGALHRRPLPRVAGRVLQPAVRPS